MKLYLAIKKVIDELGIDAFKSSVAVNVSAALYVPVIMLNKGDISCRSYYNTQK